MCDNIRLLYVHLGEIDTLLIKLSEQILKVFMESRLIFAFTISLPVLDLSSNCPNFNLHL